MTQLKFREKKYLFVFRLSQEVVTWHLCIIQSLRFLQSTLTSYRVRYFCFQTSGSHLNTWRKHSSSRLLGLKSKFLARNLAILLEL